MRNLNGRLTWAVSPRNKLNFSVDVSKGLHGAGNLGLSQVSPEAWVSFHYRKKPGTQVTWNAPLTSRLLLEAGGEFDNNTVGNIPAFPTAVTPGATEQSSNLRFRSQLGGFATTDYLHHQANYRFLRGAASYVTGSHALKVGLQLMPASATTTYDLLNGGPAYYVTLLNGAPRSVTYLATPRTQEVSNVILGLYGQDQWTLRRLTVNAGLRFDSMNAGYPDARHAPTPILPSIEVPGQTVLKWRDVSPRIGVAYDLFGTGKTAVKASVNRYIIPELAHGRVLTQGLQAGGGFTLSRTWNDATICAGCVNGDFVPQGDPLNPAANGELGPSPNRFFGQAFVTNRFDSEWAHGWGVRPFNWEMSASLQHQLAEGVGANVGYFRRLYGNFVVTDNLAVSPGDYDPFCVTAPADSRFPTGGGQQICGLFDLNPAKVGQQDVITTRSSNYGKQLERFNGVDASIDMRLKGGVFLPRRLERRCADDRQLRRGRQDRQPQHLELSSRAGTAQPGQAVRRLSTGMGRSRHRCHVSGHGGRRQRPRLRRGGQHGLHECTSQRLAESQPILGCERDGVGERHRTRKPVSPTAAQPGSAIRRRPSDRR